MAVTDRNVGQVFDKIDEKLIQVNTKLDEIKEPSPSKSIKFLTAVNSIILVLLSFFTYNLNRNVHEINSSYQSSHLVSELNDTLTNKEAQRDIAIIALTRLNNPFGKNKISKADRAEKNQAYMIYEVTKRLANVAQTDYKEAIIEFNPKADKNIKKSFASTAVESYGLIHRKHMEAGKILDKVLDAKDKETLGITLNDNEKIEDVFTTRATNLYNEAAREVASNIKLTDIKQNSSDKPNLEIDRFIDRYSSQTMNELLGNKAPIFIRYDYKFRYYKFGNDSKFQPKRVFPAFMKEVLGRNENDNSAIDDIKYYMLDLYSPMAASQKVCGSQIRYFREEDRKLAEELQKSLREKLDPDILEERQENMQKLAEKLNPDEISDFSAFKTLSTLIDTSFTPVIDYEWAKNNQIDVRHKQLELLIVFKEQQQNNSKISDNCKITE